MSDLAADGGEHAESATVGVVETAELPPSQMPDSAEAAAKQLPDSAEVAAVNGAEETQLPQPGGVEAPAAGEAVADQLPPLQVLPPQALADGVDALGWEPLPALSRDENGMDLALLAARSSKCKCGSMGCVIASEAGQILAVHVNSAIWKPDVKRPNSDVHAEINALGFCARAAHGVAQGAHARGGEGCCQGSRKAGHRGR